MRHHASAQPLIPVPCETARSTFGVHATTPLPSFPPPFTPTDALYSLLAHLGLFEGPSGAGTTATATASLLSDSVAVGEAKRAIRALTLAASGAVTGAAFLIFTRQRRLREAAAEGALRRALEEGFTRFEGRIVQAVADRIRQDMGFGFVVSPGSPGYQYALPAPGLPAVPAGAATAALSPYYPIPVEFIPAAEVAQQRAAAGGSVRGGLPAAAAAAAAADGDAEQRATGTGCPPPTGSPSVFTPPPFIFPGVPTASAIARGQAQRDQYHRTSVEPGVDTAPAAAQQGASTEGDDIPSPTDQARIAMRLNVLTLSCTVSNAFLSCPLRLRWLVRSLISLSPFIDAADLPSLCRSGSADATPPSPVQRLRSSAARTPRASRTSARGAAAAAPAAPAAPLLLHLRGTCLSPQSRRTGPQLQRRQHLACTSTTSEGYRPLPVFQAAMTPPAQVPRRGPGHGRARLSEAPPPAGEEEARAA